MASTASFQTYTAAPLVGSVAGASSGLIDNADTYRRYRAGLSVGVFEHGSYRHHRRSIFYEVGRRFNRRAEALAYVHGDIDIEEIDASVPINPAQAASFEGWARKYSNFSPQWLYMDLAAVAERLAKSVAAQSVYGDVSTATIRAGQPIRVTALGTLDSPQTASNASVFIPRTVDTVGNDHVFAVLAAAANGEGAAVTTDVLRLDATTNQPILPAVEGASLATACVEALRVVGANMEESGAGDVFAYAVTRGIHHVVSVVSHTDEGGWMRGVLRSCTLRVPYGGINQALRDYPALPVLASTSAGSVSSWVDGIALKTAAAVAHCDPCVNATGGTYPTVLTAARGPVLAPGSGEVNPTDADATVIGRQIAADVGRFAPAYTRALMDLFGLRAYSGIADSVHCTATRSALDETTDRHLRHKTVAPYFWIEPTSLIKAGQFGLPAEAAGFGALVTAGEQATRPCFEQVTELDRGRHADFCTVAFKMRSARTSGLVSAYAGTPAELAGLKLYQFDESSIVLAGSQGNVPGDVPAKHAVAEPVSSYLWTRGQSPIPAPAEFINTQGVYGAKYKVVSWDDDFDATLSDLPEAWELEAHPTIWRTSIPTALPQGPSNFATPDVRRARSRASIALAQSSLRARAWGESNSPVISVSNVPPSLGPLGPVTVEGGDVHRSDPGSAARYGVGAPVANAPDERAAPVGPIPHQQPLRGAQYPRVGGGQLGGVGAAGAPPGPPGAGGAGPPPPGPAPPADDGGAGPAGMEVGGAPPLIENAAAAAMPAPQQ
nr:coat protein [Erysiphe necator associated victorivirus 1]